MGEGRAPQFCRDGGPGREEERGEIPGTAWWHRRMTGRLSQQKCQKLCQRRPGLLHALGKRLEAEPCEGSRGC